MRINIYRGQVDFNNAKKVPDNADEMPDTIKKVPDTIEGLPDNEQEQQIYKYVLENEPLQQLGW